MSFSKHRNGVNFAGFFNDSQDDLERWFYCRFLYFNEFNKKSCLFRSGEIGADKAIIQRVSFSTLPERKTAYKTEDASL